MKKLFTYLRKFIVFLFLTIFSQIGGIVYLLSLWISKKIQLKLKYKTLILFCLLYSISTFLIVPKIALLGGRERVIHLSNLKAANVMEIILNRNYVRKELNELLIQTSKELQQQDPHLQIRYLDACFPFWNGFPLLPHLSHNDGKKIDLSFVYEDQNGNIINKSKSISGYGVFEIAKKNESDQTKICKNRGYFQYDFPKYLSFGKINRDLQFSERGTRLLLISLLKQKSLSKLFIEPHLKKRMNLNHSKIRFQGCQSVRHDDHIHLQIK